MRCALGPSPPRGFRDRGQAWRRSHRTWTSSPGASIRSGGRFDIDRKRARVELIERESVQPGFWEDQKRAQALSKEKSDLELQLAQYERERQRLEDAVALYELAEEANDEAARHEARKAGAEAEQGAQRPKPAKKRHGPQGTPHPPLRVHRGARVTQREERR